MKNTEKAVMRFSNGEILKGYLKEFSPDLAKLTLKEAGTDKAHLVRIEDVKAVFFVRSFEGDNAYKEKKSYGVSKPKGRKVYIKFKDGESMVGFLDGEVPWDKGFFLSKQDHEKKGFFLLPVDEDANNIKVFVVVSSVDYVTVVP